MYGAAADPVDVLQRYGAREGVPFDPASAQVLAHCSEGERLCKQAVVSKALSELESARRVLRCAAVIPHLGCDVGEVQLDAGDQRRVGRKLSGFCQHLERLVEALVVVADLAEKPQRVGTLRA